MEQKIKEYTVGQMELVQRVQSTRFTERKNPEDPRTKKVYVMEPFNRMNGHKNDVWIEADRSQYELHVLDNEEPTNPKVFPLNQTDLRLAKKAARWIVQSGIEKQTILLEA